MNAGVPLDFHHFNTGMKIFRAMIENWYESKVDACGGDRTFKLTCAHLEWSCNQGFFRFRYLFQVNLNFALETRLIFLGVTCG